MFDRLNSRIVGLRHSGRNNVYSGRAGLYNAVQSGLPAPWQFDEVLAYLDARYGVTAASERVSAWAATLKGSISADQATGANQPIHLPWSGTNYLWLSEVNGNYSTCPSSAALEITGDIDLRAKVSLLAYNAASTQALLAKDDSSTNRDYWLAISNAGNLLFVYSPDGTTLRAASSSITLQSVLSVNVDVWLRATYNSSTGKVNFYRSFDGSSWTAVGTEQTITSGSIHTSSAPVRTAQGTTSVPGGKIYRQIIKSGIDGTTVYDADYTAVAEGATSFTESANGATVTINSTGAKPAQIVGSPQILFDGAAHYLEENSLVVAQPLVLVGVFKTVTWGAAGFLCGSAPVPTNLQVTYRNSTPEIDLFAGTALQPVTTDLAVGTYGVLASTFNGASSKIQVNLGSPVTGNPGTDGLSVLSIGATSAPNGYANIQCKALAVLNSSPSASRLNQLIAAMARQHGISV